MVGAKGISNLKSKLGNLIVQMATSHKVPILLQKIQRINVKDKKLQNIKNNKKRKVNGPPKNSIKVWKKHNLMENLSYKKKQEDLLMMMGFGYK